MYSPFQIIPRRGILLVPVQFCYSQSRICRSLKSLQVKLPQFIWTFMQQSGPLAFAIFAIMCNSGLMANNRVRSLKDVPYLMWLVQLISNMYIPPFEFALVLVPRQCNGTLALSCDGHCATGGSLVVSEPDDILLFSSSTEANRSTEYSPRYLSCIDIPAR